MPLTSLRFGFATNSSSSHSVVFSKDAQLLKAVREHDTLHGESISRDNFVITNPERKKILLIDALGMGAWNEPPENQHERLRLKRFIARKGLEDFTDSRHAFQTERSLSVTLGCPDNIDIDLWFDFICCDQIAVVGHDGDSEQPDNLNPIFCEGLGITIDRWNWTWKQDGPDTLVGYDRTTGQKIRWSRHAEHTKGTTPELVDVKITDWCGYGCAFCYQGSTKAGQHAPLERIQDIAKELGKLGVFEVALGGGEPVHHPQFPEIVKAFASAGVTVNFTTYGVDWSQSETIVKALKTHRSHVGAVGVSVHGPRDLIKITRIKDNLIKNQCWNITVTAQTVMGATPLKTIHQLMDLCIEQEIPLLLLGYKTTGRGQEVKPSPLSSQEVQNLLKKAKDVFRKHPESTFQLSVDTAFLDQHGDALDAAGVPHVLRSSPEGAFSLCIDAVENTIAPSSYVPENQRQVLKTPGDILEHFATY